MKATLEFEYSATDIQEFPVTEMIGFDAFANKLKQGANRWGRDQVIGADELDLTFWNDVYVLDSERGFYDEHGYYITFATHCFDKLLDISNEKAKGFEATVRLKLYNGNTVYVSGELDFSEMKTDEKTRFSCNIVVETKTALLDRRADFEPDVFSNTGVDGKPIVPLQRMKFLQKALPEFQKSEYASPSEVSIQYRSTGLDAMVVNSATQAVGTLGIENSYIINGSGIPGESTFGTAYQYVGTGYTTEILTEVLDRFKLFIAADDYTNLNIKISGLNAFIGDSTGLFTRKQFILSWGTNPITDRQNTLFFNTDGTLNISNQSYEFTIPFVARGQTVWLYMVAFQNASGGGLISTTDIIVSGMKVVGTAYVAAIDVVVEVVRYEDYFAKGVEQLTGLPLVAPRITTGEYSNQFTLNGNMCRPNLNKPLNFVFKNEAEDLRALRLDYQCSNTKIDIASKDDFYPNVDLGFLDFGIPVDIEKTLNERAKINLVNIEFSNYEKSDDTDNTNESFHTKGQWNTLNKKVENKLEIKINTVFDPKRIQKIIKQALRETTATDNDNTIIRIDGYPLAPGTKGGFPAVLGIQVSNGILTILNKDPLKDVAASFKWTQTGISVGQNFHFSWFNPENGLTGEYDHTVLEIQDTIIRLQPIGYTPNWNGSYLIVTSFFYTGVNWTNRTTEGFTDISGLGVADRWSNLRFGVGNILDLYSSDINEYMAAYPDEAAKNISFINNGEFSARFQDGRLIKQGADLLPADRKPKVLDNAVFKTKGQIPFEMGVYILEATTSRNPDGNTIGGFFRIMTNSGLKKVHIEESSYLWRSETIEIAKCAVRNESDFTVIEVIAGVLYIDGAQYIDGFEWFEVNSDEKLTMFDRRNHPLIFEKPYQKVTINGNSYTNVVDFVAALENV